MKNGKLLKLIVSCVLAILVWTKLTEMSWWIGAPATAILVIFGSYLLNKLLEFLAWLYPPLIKLAHKVVSWRPGNQLIRGVLLYLLRLTALILVMITLVSGLLAVLLMSIQVYKGFTIPWLELFKDYPVAALSYSVTLGFCGSLMPKKTMSMENTRTTIKYIVLRNPLTIYVGMPLYGVYLVIKNRQRIQKWLTTNAPLFVTLVKKECPKLLWNLLIGFHSKDCWMLLTATTIGIVTIYCTNLVIGLIVGIVFLYFDRQYISKRMLYLNPNSF